MAAIIDFTLTSRFFPFLSFGDGKGLVLREYYGPGPVRHFSRSEIPEIAFLETPHKALPEFLCIDAKLAVSYEVQALIEELEPGQHQFFAVNIQRERGSKPIFCRDGSPLQTPYYMLIPGIRLDAVWIEKSEVEISKITPELSFIWPKVGKETQIVLRRSVIKNHHVWAGKLQLGRSTFFSDTLVQAVLDRKWKGLRFTHLQEQ